VVERQALVEALLRVGGNKARAARLLQIDYKTIQTKIRKYGISLNERASYEEQTEPN
jgi:two-component system nitrogen regulation response regulator GlnG